jgi:KDO2-lipid IV(A) lauroyltransferase
LFALRARAPVFVAFALRDPGPAHRYTVTFEALSYPPSGDLVGDVEGLTASYTRVLEAAVKAAPQQYFWQHRRWKGTALEEPRPDGQFTTL